jgi:predicted RNA-binding Zn-ribbon protein involved in translation (DUF1610 family)
MAMNEIRHRRSPRLAQALPIRVYGIDFKGRDFVEDSTTLVVGQQGAKIRLTRQLVPEQEIRILCMRNDREALFRVVGKAGVSEGPYTFWGVECLNAPANIWDVSASRLKPKEQGSVGVMLKCPNCGMREQVFVTQGFVESIRKMKGMSRSCPACGKLSLWKQIRFEDS